jgi:Domain of unknown function (DUF3870)
MQSKEKTLIVGGQARLPKEMSDAEVFQVIAEVEAATGKVLEVEMIPCPALIAGLLRPMLVGLSLRDDVSAVLHQIEQRLFHKSKKAVMVAIKDMIWEYRESQSPKRLPPDPEPLNR